MFSSFGRSVPGWTETAVDKKLHWKAIEIAAGYSIFQGIYHYSHPVAWILLGVAGVIAGEMRT
jgi:hypothetical protein